MRLALRNDVLCSLEFYRQGAPLPLIIGPYKMVPSLLTGCLKYDLSDPSLYQKVAADLNRLTELWAGDRAKKILPTAVAIRRLNHGQVELIIGPERYNLTSTNTPVLKKKPEHSLYSVTTDAADSEIRGLASSSRERERPRIERVRGPSSLAAAQSVGAQRFDEETRRECGASKPSKRPRLEPAVATQTRLHAVRLLHAGVYESELLIPYFAKVFMKIEAELSCSLAFLFGDNTSQVSLGPYRMMISLRTGCLKFDLEDVSVRSRVVGAFRALSKKLSLEGLPRLYATEIEVCGSLSGQVELSIANTRYPMQPTKASIETSRPLETQESRRAVGTPGGAAVESFLGAKSHQPTGRAPPSAPPMQAFQTPRVGFDDADLFEDLWAQLTRSPTEPSPGDLIPDALLDYLDPMHEEVI